MISAIGASSLGSALVLPSALASSGDASRGSGPAPTTVSPEDDTLPLAQRELLPSSEAARQRMSLTLAARSHWRITDEGQVRATSHTKLRFRYSFEAADGTKIDIRAEANLHYSQITLGGDQLESTRMRAKAVVRVIQENVASGTGSLLETAQISPEESGVVSQALDLFQQVTEAAAELFLDSDPLDGDRLIQGLVEAFNGLSESIGSIFLAAPANPDAALPGDASPSPESLPADPDVLVAVPALTETAPISAGEPDSLPGASPTGTHCADEHETELAASVREAETSAPDDEALSEIEADEVAPLACGEPSPPTVCSVMYRVRLQVMQSLTSLVRVFDSDRSTLLATQSTLKASIKLAARYDASGPTVGGPLCLDNRIDTQA